VDSGRIEPTGPRSMNGKRAGKGVLRSALKLSATGAALLLALAGLLLLYLQTPHGLKHLLLPVLSALLPVDLDVGRGRLSLAGRLEAQGFACAVPSAGLDITADRLRARLDLARLIREGRFHLPAVDARGVRLVWNAAAEATGEDAAAEKPRPEEERAEETGGDTGFLPVPFPVSVEVAHLDDVVFEALQEDDRCFRAGPARLTVRGLAADSTAALRLDTPAAVTAAGGERYAASIRQEIEFTQDARGAVTEVRAEGEISLTEAPRPLRPGQLFRGRLAGRLAGGALDAVELEIAASRQGVALGTVRGHAERRAPDPGPAAGGGPLSVRLRLEGLTADFLNPFLAILGRGQAAAGRLDADAALEQSGDAWRFAGGVKGQGLSMRLPGTEAATPSIDLTLEPKGAWDAGDGTLTLEQVGARIQQQGRLLLTAALDRPLTLHLQQQPAACSAAGPAGPAQEPPRTQPVPDVHLTVRVARTQVPSLVPWLELFRAADPLAAVAEGSVEGDVEVVVSGVGQQVRCQASLLASGLVGRKGGGFPGPGPLSVKARVAGTARNGFREISVAPSRVEIFLARQPLASAGVQGTLRPAEGRLDLKVDLGADSLPGALQGLDLVPRAQGVRLHGGKLSGQCGVAAGKDGAGIRVQGRLELKDLQVERAGGGSLKRSLAVQGDVAVQESGTRVAMDSLSIREEAGAQAPGGILSGSGVLLLKERPGERAVRLEVTGKGLSLAPWLALAGRPAPAALGDLPVDVRLSVERDPAAGRLVVQGTEEFSLPAEAGATSGKAVRVRLSNRVERDEDGGVLFQAELNAQRGEGQPPDSLALQGAYRKPRAGGAAGKPQVRGALHVENLDAALYLDPLLGGAAPARAAVPAPPAAPGAAAAAEEPAPEDAGAPETAPLDALEAWLDALPLYLDVEAQVDRFRLRNVLVTGLKATVIEQGDNLQVSVPRAGISGGTYSVEIQFRHAAGARGLVWHGSGSQIDLGALFAAFRPGKAAPVEGIASLHSSCQGTARTGEALEDSLTGTASLELDKGRFGQWQLMDFIARTTGVESFRRMAFDVCQAEVVIGQGVAKLQNTYVSGSAVRLAARGKVSLRGKLDIAITPYLMPGLSGMVKEVKLASSLMKTVQGFLLIPVEIRIGGSYTHPRYLALPVPGQLLKAGSGLLRDVVGGVVREGVSFVKDTVQEGPVNAVGSRLKKGGEITVDTVKGSGQLVGKTVDKTDKALDRGAGLVRKSGRKDAEEEAGFFRRLFGGRKGKSQDAQGGTEAAAEAPAGGTAAPAAGPPDPPAAGGNGP